MVKQPIDFIYIMDYIFFGNWKFMHRYILVSVLKINKNDDFTCVFFTHTKNAHIKWTCQLITWIYYRMVRECTIHSRLISYPHFDFGMYFTLCIVQQKIKSKKKKKTSKWLVINFNHKRIKWISVGFDMYHFIQYFTHD